VEAGSISVGVRVWISVAIRIPIDIWVRRIIAIGIGISVAPVGPIIAVAVGAIMPISPVMDGFNVRLEPLHS
jgi:hypothetical protein